MSRTGVLHIECIDASHDALAKRGSVAEPIIHDLRIRPNIDSKAIYKSIHIDSKAAKNAIYIDGVDVLQEIGRLRDEIRLLLHVGKEAE